ncbi:hypothetical protein EH223_00275 [candidate division KSB1 bacterium]|nr:hypothetical protein [candidate division KSB1 bacterium]RQW07356.1 MAG: hypothetical protein EH223_00275 [candidate division KSB1 bacterium]
MIEYGDNPFDDGLDFSGCPPKPVGLKLPRFPENFKSDCKFLRWARCWPHVPDGQTPMFVKIDDFEPDESQCGVYNGEVHFYHALTNEEWYKGELKFYYTRNYLQEVMAPNGQTRKRIAFRFVAKGDLERVGRQIPDNFAFISCTKPVDDVHSYKQIFVYGGLDIFFDTQPTEQNFMLALGHNDGWLTHHPKCSKRPIDWNGPGSIIGHYSNRGWLFVSPGRNFVFDPRLHPPTGRFCEEAVRQVDKQCYTEDATKYGYLSIQHIHCIHSYQQLWGMTECNTVFQSSKSCQGLHYTAEPHSWLTFLSMGYWRDSYRRKYQTLHLSEGSIKFIGPISDELENGLYFYGFSTQSSLTDLKLVDYADNRDVIGAPAPTRLLIYLYNAGKAYLNPPLRDTLEIDPEFSTQLIRKEIILAREKNLCPFTMDKNE